MFAPLRKVIVNKLLTPGSLGQNSYHFCSLLLNRTFFFKWLNSTLIVVQLGSFLPSCSLPSGHNEHRKELYAMIMVHRPSCRCEQSLLVTCKKAFRLVLMFSLSSMKYFNINTVSHTP